MAHSGAGTMRSASAGSGGLGETRPFLHATHKVGGVETSMNYTLEERAFHRQDMPPWAREARKTVKGMISGARSGASGWDTTVSVPPPPKGRRGEISAFDPTEYVYNYRAEVLPKARPVERDVFGRIIRLVLDTPLNRTIEMPVHPSLEGKQLWDLSTTIAPGELDKSRAVKDTAHFTATKRSTAAWLARSEDRGRAHISCEQKEADRMTTLRAQRAAAAVVYSPQSLKAMQEHELAWDADFRNTAALREAIKPATAPVRDRPDPRSVEAAYDRTIAATTRRSKSTTLRDRSYQRYKHEGVYQAPSVGGGIVKGGMWSCCGAEGQEARGCVAMRVDPDRHRYDSFCD